jgi:hypothetical protein
MKYIYSLIVILLLSFNVFADKKKNETIKPWQKASTKEPFKQGGAGSVEIYIKIEGSDYADCILNAEKAAVHLAIFKGYNENQEKNIPKMFPLAKESVYDQNLSYFDAFFADAGPYKSYVDKSTKHPTMLAEMKIDKHTVEANIIVTININNLSQRLIDDHIIQPLIAQGVAPATVLVVPDDSYMDRHGYVKNIDAGGYSTTIYDLVSAGKDPALETAINTIAAALTGEGKGLKKIELGEAQSALETNDAVQEVAQGAETKKSTPAEVLNNKATWDYTIKVQIIETINGTAVDYNIQMKILDMYTLTSETADPILMTLTSAGNRDQQIKRGLLGSMEQLSNKIAANYRTKLSSGYNGKVNFYIGKESKGNFNSSVTMPSGSSKILGDLSILWLKKFTLKEMGKQPQVEGTASVLARKYNNVWIPYEVTYKDEDEIDVTEPNSFQTLSTLYIEKVNSLKIPGLNVTSVFHKGSVDFYFNLLNK